MEKNKNTDLYFDSPSSKKQYWFAIKELTAREIKRKYARSYLGIVWSILNPLLNMIVLSLIFSYMFRNSIDYFPVYLITGQTIFSLFSVGTNSAMTSIADNKTLIQRTRLPKQIFILSRIYTAFVNFTYTLIPLVAVVLFFRIKITWTIVLIIPDLVLLTGFIIGTSYVLATMYVFFADIKHFYGIFITLLMYCSAIFYPATRLPDFMRYIISFNPVYLAIDIARHALIYGVVPYYTEWIKLFIASFIMLVLGYRIFSRTENDMMMHL